MALGMCPVPQQLPTGHQDPSGRPCSEAAVGAARAGVSEWRIRRHRQATSDRRIDERYRACPRPALGRGAGEGVIVYLDSSMLARAYLPDEPGHEQAMSLDLVREYAIRAMDAWHLAVAALALPSLVEPEEEAGFATRDEALSSVAMSLGLRLVQADDPRDRVALPHRRGSR
jgi:hypothetical protein